MKLAMFAKVWIMAVKTRLEQSDSLLLLVKIMEHEFRIGLMRLQEQAMDDGARVVIIEGKIVCCCWC